MNIDPEMNGGRHCAPPRGVETAAALRWFLARLGSAGAEPHELLEYQAAADVLATLESTYPGLARFVDEVTTVARGAAGLKLATSFGAPREVIAELQGQVTAGWNGLARLERAIPTDAIEQLLQCCARLSDITGALAR